MPTNTPPPYFPQNPLSPPDEKRARSAKVVFFGCIAFLLLFIAGFIVGMVYLIRWLF
ncbi:MAG TPA: hypothetical protein VF723_02995 [Pyrinomonadaceae bacterium]